MPKLPHDPTAEITALVAKFGGEVVDTARIRALETWDIRIEPSRNARKVRMSTVTMRYHATQLIAVFPERAAFHFIPTIDDLIRQTSFS